MYEAMIKRKGNTVFNISENKSHQPRLTLPWWCIFPTYILSILLVAMSILLLIARSIELGDMKTQQWLTSVVTGFFSSICLTQPLKVGRLMDQMDVQIVI